MAHVPYVQAADATGRSAEILEEFEAEHDKRSLLLEALANHPLLLDAHSTYFDQTVARGNLDWRLKELAGVVVSEANECAYCASSHRGNLVEMFGVPRERVEAVADGEYGAFSERERAAMEFAERVADDPKRVTEADVDALREAGFDDAAVVELLGAIGQFAVANIYADTLSIRPDDR